MAPDSVIYDTWYIFWYVGFCVDEIVESVRGLHFLRVLFQSLQNGLTSPVAASLTPRTISAFESHIRHHKMFLFNTWHIFQKKQEATNKKVHKFWFCFRDSILCPLSHGVMGFVLIASLRNLFLTSENS